MKVDKAVCTNDTLEDITRAIKYEAIFTTLVENKILAIKRECEEKKKAKKQKRRSFGRILFGRRIFGGGASGSGISSSGKRPSEESIIRRKNAILVALGQIQKQPVKGIDDIKPQRDSIVSEVQVSDKSSSIRFKEADIESGIEDATDSLRKVFLSRPDSQCDDSIDSNGDESIASRGARDLVVEVLTHRDGYPYDDSDGDKDSVVLSVIEKQPPDISSLGSYRVGGDNTSTLADESLTSVKDSSESLSFPSSRCTMSAAFGTAISLEKERHRLRVLEAKSISAQCSPILPRQKLRVHTVQTQTHGKPLRQVSYVDEICRNGIGNDGDGKIIFKAGKNGNTTLGDKMKIFSRQTTSDDSANLTLSTLLNEQDATFMLPERKCKSTSILVVTDKNNKKAINRLDSNSIVSYQSNPIGRGLISSFNQLTTPSNGLPVITTTVTTYPNAKTSSQVIYSQQSQSIKSSKECLKEQKLVHPSTASTSFITKTIHQQQQKAVGGIISTPSVPCDTNTKLQRITSTSTGSSGGGPTGCCTTKSIVKEKDKRPKPPNWEVGQSGSDDEYRKRKRKYKRHHRCSDPILVYPSTTGLQHCILSMPPNQPIEFHYNDDFVYDVALQVENDKNSDLQAIVPNHRTHRHRHHRHKKRHRHKKPKILVHDLDTQSVKVIDPDDLPQRARWTIIATACLLLLMCLMLVGITLRMAPIIDDMVRQENERLMQESLNRAKLTKNLTEAASFTANEEIP